MRKMKQSWTEFESSQLSNISSVLITGGSGVIGKHLISTLDLARNLGYFSGEIIATVRNGDIEELKRLGADVVFRGDLTKGSAFIEFEKWDYCFHGASPSQPSEFLRDPLVTIKLNTEVTTQLKSRTKESFLFMSSSEVYSGLSHPPLESEIGTTTPDHPRAPYIESKRLGEVVTKLSPGAPEELRSNVARIALAYGPGAALTDTRVMYELVRRGLQEGEVRLKGGHDLVRTYCHAGDTAEILIRIALLCSNSTVNVGGLEPVTMRYLAKLIAMKTGANYVEDSFDTPPMLGQMGSPASVSLNLDLMRELTGFTDFIALEDGIVQVIDYYREKI